MNETVKIQHSKRRLSTVWLIPIVAIAIGAWLIYKDIKNQGPQVILHFDHAEGIEAGKTQLRHRSINIGKVLSVELNDTLDGVVVRAEVKPGISPMLRDDTQFWVVRPRIGNTGISGLGTLLSGAYIELSPGEGVPGQRVFLGLDEPPVTPASAPGLQVNLYSESGSSLSTGDPVMYRGFTVGKVESATFNPDTRKLKAQLFIEAPYDSMVTDTTRFWSASGVSLNTSASGIELKADSIESILFGGISFGQPNGIKPGTLSNDGDEFTLYENEAAIHLQPFTHSIEYLVLFESSVRGLLAGAPVEFRGMHVGSVTDISFNELPDHYWEIADDSFPVPVKISIDPGRLNGEDTLEMKQRASANILASVKNGLRATLRNGSFLTGSMYVSLEYFPDSEPKGISRVAGYNVLPSTESGLSVIETKVNQTLDNLNQLPIEQALLQLSSMLKETETTMESLNTLVSDKELAKLPATFNESLIDMEKTLDAYSEESIFYHDLNETLTQMRATLVSVDQFTNILKNKPNEMLFSNPRRADPVPAKKQ